MEGGRAWCTGGHLYLSLPLTPPPPRHLWQLPNAALCTKAAALLETISEHAEGSPAVRARSALLRKLASPRVSRGGAAARAEHSRSLPHRPLPLRRFHSEDSGEPRLALTPRRTKSSPPSSRPRGLAEGVASSSKAEIGSRSPRCSEIASRAPRRSELVPEKAFSEKVSALLFAELKRAGAQSRRAAAEATAAEALRVAEAEAAEAAEAKATAAEAEAARQAAAAAVAAGATAKAKEAEGRAEAAASAEIEALRARAESAERRLERANPTYPYPYPYPNPYPQSYPYPKP